LFSSVSLHQLGSLSSSKRSPAIVLKPTEFLIFLSFFKFMKSNIQILNLS
jgi:hypothetical protein